MLKSIKGMTLLVSILSSTLVLFLFYVVLSIGSREITPAQYQQLSFWSAQYRGKISPKIVESMKDGVVSVFEYDIIAGKAFWLQQTHKDRPLLANVNTNNNPHLKLIVFDDPSSKWDKVKGSNNE